MFAHIYHGSYAMPLKLYPFLKDTSALWNTTFLRFSSDFASLLTSGLDADKLILNTN